MTKPCTNYQRRIHEWAASADSIYRQEQAVRPAVSFRGENRPNPRQTYQFLTPSDVYPAHVETDLATINNGLDTKTIKREKIQHLTRTPFSTATKPTGRLAPLASGLLKNAGRGIHFRSGLFSNRGWQVCQEISDSPDGATRREFLLVQCSLLLCETSAH